MCGIFAYAGTENAVPFLIDGLRSVEYRGYDSAGIAVIGDDGKIRIARRGDHRASLASLAAAVGRGESAALPRAPRRGGVTSPLSAPQS